MKKILLLGGSGYIGSKFYSLFSDRYHIRSIDLHLFNKDKYSEHINYNLIDIESFDIILCFAGHSSVQMCEYSPGRSWINNVDYFHNLCKKLKNNQKLIYMSSASVYGNSNVVCNENLHMSIKPIQNYDLQKIIIDIIANKYINNGKKIIGLRLGTVNGSSLNTRKDLMLNSMIKNALDNNFIYIKNLEMRRSILGINDLMRALECFIKHNCESGQYNLASFSMSVKQLAECVYKNIKCNIIENESDKITYSFEIETSKFERTMNFTFKDDPDIIVNDLIKNHNITSYSTRDNDGEFEKYI